MRSLKCTCFVIFVAVCVTDLIDHFDTLKIIGPAKTGPAGPLPTAMVSNGIHTSDRHTDGVCTHVWLAHVCQAAYTISKDVHHSLTSLIGTPRRDRVGSAPRTHPPHPASPSLTF